MKRPKYGPSICTAKLKFTNPDRTEFYKDERIQEYRKEVLELGWEMYNATATDIVDNGSSVGTDHRLFFKRAK